MNLRSRDTRWPDARLEAELPGWLRKFEPAGTPIALRLRISADLHAEADRPRRRLLRMQPALSSVGMLAAVVVGVGLVLLLAVVGASLGHGVGSPVTAPPPDASGQQTSDVLGAYGILAWLLPLIAGSALMAAVVCVPVVRHGIGRLALGRGEAAPSAPRALRRPLREVPLSVWALAALTVAITLWTWQVFRAMIAAPAIDFLWWVYWLIEGPVLALAVRLRYPLRDRASRMMMSGCLALSMASLCYLAALTGSLAWNSSWGLPMEVLFYANAGLTSAGCLALVAGLAGRAGITRRPPIGLVALLTGVAFCAELQPSFGWVFYAFPAITIDISTVDSLIGDLSRWLTLVGWLAMIWIGVRAGTRRGLALEWLLVACAGILIVSCRVVGLGFGWGILPWELLQGTWREITAASLLGAVCLLAALLIGLRPHDDGAAPAVPGSTGE